MKSQTLLFILLILVSHHANGQDAALKSLLHRKSVQLSIGTQGLGAEFSYGILPRLALSAGGNVVPINASNIFEISGLNSTSEVSADFYNLHLMADYTPFDNLSWLRFVGGVAYFF